MNEIYMGVEHITDLNGYDHMLYLLALVAWASLAMLVRRAASDRFYPRS